ncbi:sensor histidine kinase [Candidatus Levibacter sp. Uisw_134_01]|uniref:sensor histidine kinase N-terminal domain-containing protein n=1 Tax=Candidatus Levibacter sp. Uisw_134_01 TaxID=3230999 RepID=UPI003D4C5CB9
MAINLLQKINFPNLSIKQRLVLQLGIVTILIAFSLFFLIKNITNQVMTTTQDRLLTASLNSIIDKFYTSNKDISLDLPYDTFSLLGAISEDKLFYKIDYNDKFLTGYQKFPMVLKYGNLRKPIFYNLIFENEKIRVAAIKHSIYVNGKKNLLFIQIGQTLNFQSSISSQITNNLLLIILIFMVLSIILVLLATRIALQPITLLANDLNKRKPNDLTLVKNNVPIELAPLILSLNSFVKKFRGVLRTTETFVAEAAHHIRTPLAIVKSESEIAFLKSKTKSNRAHLRNIIRSIDETNRYTTQLLDNAMVLYRLEKLEKENFSITKSLVHLINVFKPAAELKDINFSTTFNFKSKFIVTDKLLFETAIRNLIDNSIKYAPIETNINLDYKFFNNVHEIKINNQINKKLNTSKSTLFKRFYRGQNSKNIVGSGLGLSLVNEIILGLNGQFKILKYKEKEFCISVQFFC